MAAKLIDEDPALAHQHALSASRRAGRIAIVRETLAITAYATGDYALALRELRTYRRISGSEDQIALMVDSERGVGRPDRALEVGRAVDRSTCPGASRRTRDRDVGRAAGPRAAGRALSNWTFRSSIRTGPSSGAPALFSARATVLEELGRDDEAAEWHRRAAVAADAIDGRTVPPTSSRLVEEFEEVYYFDDPRMTTPRPVTDEEPEADDPADAADDRDPVAVEPAPSDEPDGAGRLMALFSRRPSTRAARRCRRRPR